MEMANFASARDELLDRMVTDGWGNRSAGSNALVTISVAEKAECADAMSEAMAELAVDMPVGNFILRNRGAGDVTVDEYPSEVSAVAAYLEL